MVGDYIPYTRDMDVFWFHGFQPSISKQIFDSNLVCWSEPSWHKKLALKKGWKHKTSKRFFEHKRRVLMAAWNEADFKSINRCFLGRHNKAHWKCIDFFFVTKKVGDLLCVTMSSFLGALTGRVILLRTLSRKGCDWIRDYQADQLKEWDENRWVKGQVICLTINFTQGHLPKKKSNNSQ